VAYDEALAERVREMVADRPGVSEQKMFGGLAFLIGGNMALAASGQGGLLVRLDAAEGERLIASGAAQPMEMRGREMRGWLRVSSDAVRTKRQLARWVDLGISYAASLPPKSPKRRSRR
jgi:TfoX/Sxy family transcriptional regulator of competence genes